jgi:uncharacterized protein YdhG (YjbR/CyaY superfamily)
MEENKSIKTVDEYINQFSDEIRERLLILRKTVNEIAQEAAEKISYNMPAFAYKGILVYFAAHKSHIGFYPTASGIEAFKDKLSEYKSSKGAIQFPNDKPLPLDLVREIVSYRVSENAKK